MALEIVWSPRALDNFHEVILYLEKNWTDLVVKDFVTRTEKVIQLISEHPEMFKQVSDQNASREAVITKHNLLIYRVYTNKILLLTVFDTRQHPRKKVVS